jgi:hypothetical protein
MFARRSELALPKERGPEESSRLNLKARLVVPPG